MYAFAQRSDMSVVDEPLYAHFLTHTNTKVEHPAKEAILEAQLHDGEEVIKQVIFGEYPTPAVLFKQMTHHFIKLSEAFLAQTDNILLIRDPRYIINSYTKVIPNPSIEDIGVREQLSLYQKLKNYNTLKAIVDARELLLNPEGVLRQLCRQLELDYDPAMLHWEAGPRPEDGVWASFWYSNVHQSTGFKPYTPKEIQLPPAMEALALECQPYYEELYRHAIKA